MVDKDVMKAIKDHVSDRTQHLIDTFLNGPNDNPAMALADALGVLADSFRTEADLWAASRSKGWQSTATRLREGAKLVQEVGEALGKLAAETPSAQLREPAVIEHQSDGFVYREPAVGVPLGEAIANQGDTLAYLRGDIDTLPVDPPPPAVEPSTNSPDINEEARQVTQTFPIDPSAMAGIVNGPLGALPDGDFTDPKPISALLKSGYVPHQTNGRTYPTFASLLAPPPASILPLHWSWSQLESSEGCGLRYRLGRVEGYTQIPAWANIGGDAFHSATAYIDLGEHEHGTTRYELPPTLITEIWQEAFNKAIAGVASTSPVPIAEWRAANGGKENQDWWRVEGEAMLARWCEARAKLAATAQNHGDMPRKLATLPHAHPEVGAGRAPAVEWPFTITVPGPLGDLAYTNIIDRVWECTDGALLVEDLKTGSRMPKDTGQLGTYAWGVAMAGGVSTHTPNGGNVPRIMGTFYNARKGLWTPAVDLLAAHPWDEFVYRLHTAEAKRFAGLYSPHVTDLCAACSVRYACPLMNREGQPGSAS